MSLVAALGILALLKIDKRQLDFAEASVALLAAAILAANFIYLLEHPPTKSEPSRIRRIFRLWVDAKEQELTRRSKPTAED